MLQLDMEAEKGSFRTRTFRAHILQAPHIKYREEPGNGVDWECGQRD